MGKFFRGLWTGLKVVQNIVATLLFLFLVVVLYTVFAGEPRPRVPDGAALVIQPVGYIVEKATERKPFQMMVQDEDEVIPETLMRDIAAAIRNAKTDERISALVIDMDYVAGAGLAQLHYIGELIRDFKRSGKPVYAYGISFSDGGYLVASFADEIYMHPLGSVILTGYGTYPLYFRAAIEKIKAKVYVFRSGEYKTLGEPFLRDDMSAEAKEANGVLLASLWDGFLEQISAARAIPRETLEASFATLPEDLRSVAGDFALLAEQQGLVDGLKTEAEWSDYMTGIVGEAGNYYGYRAIDMAGYLLATEPERSGGGDEIAIVIARGEIIMGESTDGNAGSWTVIRHLNEALYDDNVKGVVLRIDSPGGSLLASEMIREQVELLKESGKPVVVSMGAVAASGGYWIAAPADEIWAQPTTITGSIGVVGILPTFEGSLDAIGIHSDGVGTTPMSGDFQFGQPLSAMAQDVLQQSVDSSYETFVQMVAQYRGLDPEAVDAIGRGRVWSGQAAYEFGLIDSLGTLDDAVAAAGTRADLTTFHTRYIEDRPDLSQRFATWLFTKAAAPDLAAGRRPAPVQAFLAGLERAYGVLANLNDPNALYVLCEFCEVR